MDSTHYFYNSTEISDFSIACYNNCEHYDKYGDDALRNVNMPIFSDSDSDSDSDIDFLFDQDMPNSSNLSISEIKPEKLFYMCRNPDEDLKDGLINFKSEYGYNNQYSDYHQLLHWEECKINTYWIWDVELVKGAEYSKGYYSGRRNDFSLTFASKYIISNKRRFNGGETVYNIIKDDPSRVEKFIEINGDNIQYIDNPSPKQRNIAIHSHKCSGIQHFKNPLPTLEERIAALKFDGINIEFLENPTIEERRIALISNGNAIQFIKDPPPTSEERMLALTMSKNGDHSHDNTIRFIKNPTREECIAAVKCCAKSIIYIKNPSNELRLITIKEHIHGIEYLENPPPTPKERMIAITSNGWSIQYIKNPTSEERLAAVKQDGCSIQFIKDPTPEERLTAIRNDADALRFIDDPTPGELSISKDN